MHYPQGKTISWAFRGGQSNKNQSNQKPGMDLQPLSKAAGPATPGAERQQCQFVSKFAPRANCSLALWHGQTHQIQINPNKLIIWDLQQEISTRFCSWALRVFQTSSCTVVAQCNDWEGTFLKVSVKGSKALKDSASSPLRLLNVTLYCFRGAKQAYLDQKHGLQVSRDKRPEH